MRPAPESAARQAAKTKINNAHLCFIKFSMTLTEGVVFRRIMRVMRMWWLLSIAVLILAGCSSSSSSTKQAVTPVGPGLEEKSTNPAAKYIELVGFRLKEKSPGHIQVQFGVVNHSEADLGDLKLNVDLRTTASKAGDPPVLAFSANVPSLGPEDLKEVSVEVPSKARVYELPDWQFLKADFQITEPK